MNKITGYEITNLSVITVTGKDTVNFLQGQCTQDIKSLAPNIASAGAFCTAKGRTVTNVYLVKVESEIPTIQMICHASSADILLTHLKKYAAFFKGTSLTHANAALKCVGVQGNDWQEIAANITSTESFWFALPDGRGQLWLTSQVQSQILDHLDTTQLQSANLWQKLDIESHLLWLDNTQVERWIPQNYNLDTANGISLTKGCYTGQEVVARLHYKGQSKKRLAAISWQNTPDATLNLYQNQRSVGDIVQQAVVDGTTYSLVIVKSDALENPIFVDEKEQVEIQLLH